MSGFLIFIIEYRSLLAEGVGFEPTRDSHLCRFSRPVHSTALPPFPGPLVSGLGVSLLPRPMSILRRRQSIALARLARTAEAPLRRRCESYPHVT